jgi:hydrogenase maturation protease
MTPEDHSWPGVRRQPVKALVLACGNTLRGDDGVGWRIGSLLIDDPPCEGLEVILTQQLLPEHAEAVSGADAVIFVDCSAVCIPGTVLNLPVKPSQAAARIFSHHLDPAALLRLALEVYGRPPSRAVAVTVGGASFDLNEQISEAVAAAVPKSLKAVRDFLTEDEAGLAAIGEQSI